MSDVGVEVKLPDRLWNELNDLQKTSTETHTKVGILEGQSKEQVKLIRETSKQVIINTAEIGNFKEHRNGKGLIGKLLVKVFLGCV